jgi:hypothetical protein
MMVQLEHGHKKHNRRTVSQGQHQHGHGHGHGHSPGSHASHGNTDGNGGNIDPFRPVSINPFDAKGGRSPHNNSSSPVQFGIHSVGKDTTSSVQAVLQSIMSTKSSIPLTSGSNKDAFDLDLEDSATPNKQQISVASKARTTALKHRPVEVESADPIKSDFKGPEPIASEGVLSSEQETVVVAGDREMTKGISASMKLSSRPSKAEKEKEKEKAKEKLRRSSKSGRRASARGSISGPSKNDGDDFIDDDGAAASGTRGTAEIYLPTVRESISSPQTGDNLAFSSPPVTGRGRRRTSSMEPTDGGEVEADNTVGTAESEWNDSYGDYSDYSDDGGSDVGGPNDIVRAEEFIVEFLSRKEEMKATRRKNVRYVKKQSTDLIGKCMSAAMQTVDRIVGSKSAVYAMGTAYYQETGNERYNIHNYRGYTHWGVMSEPSLSTGDAAQPSLSSSPQAHRQQPRPVAGADAVQVTPSPGRKPNQLLPTDSSATGTHMTKEFEKSRENSLSSERSAEPRDSFTSSEYDTAITQLLGTARPPELKHLMAPTAAVEYAKMQQQLVALQESINVKMETLQLQVNLQSEQLSSVAATVSSQWQRVQRTVNPVGTALQAAVSRIDGCVQRVETIFSAVQLFDEEHNALVSAHRNLVQSVENKDAIVLHLVNELVTSVDNCQHAQRKQDRRLGEVAEELNDVVLHINGLKPPPEVDKVSIGKLNSISFASE